MIGNYGKGQGRALRTTPTHQAEKDRAVRLVGRECAEKLFSLAGPCSVAKGITWKAALRELVQEELR